MGKSNFASNHTLDLVVFAPIKDCVQAIDRLKRDKGAYSRHRITVETRAISDDHYEFAVKVCTVGRRASVLTQLEGTLNYDDHFHTTTIRGEVPNSHNHMEMVARLVLVALGMFAIFLAHIVNVWLGISVMALSLVGLFYPSEHVQIVDDPTRLVVIAKREILLVAHHHRQGQLKESKEESLFF